jgi:tetratricopeptide (TPR) repeat protein
LLVAGRTDAALADFKRIVEVDPTNVDALLDVGDIHSDRDELRHALGWYSRAIAVAPGSARAYYARSLTYRDLEQDEAAARDLDKAIELAPSSVLYRMGRGADALLRGHAERALADFERSLELRGPDAVLLYLRGIARFRLNDKAGAEADFAAARREEPDIDREMAEDGFVP